MENLLIERGKKIAHNSNTCTEMSRALHIDVDRVIWNLPYY